MNPACSEFTDSRKVTRWKRTRLQSALGDVATCFGDFVCGATVASLAHRHDVRVGIAAGMYLREHVTSVSLRVEVLSVVFLCYWKWAAAPFLRGLTRDIQELLGADAAGRASFYERLWEEAAQEVRELSVVGNRRDRTVQLLPRRRVRKLGGGKAHYFSYHPMMNPATRKRGDQEFTILMRDLRCGLLPRATDELAVLLAAPGANYTTCEVPLRRVRLWQRATYTRTRCLRWLFKAEGLVAEPCETDWDILAGIGVRRREGGGGGGGTLVRAGRRCLCRGRRGHVG